MNYLVYVISSLNLYFGVWFLLNAAGVIQTSKYSQIANTCFAVILIAAAAMAVYCLVFKARNSLALFIDCGPWMITILLIIASFVFGNTK